MNGPVSSVGIANGYGLDGPGIESGGGEGGEIFRTRPDRPWDPPSLLYNGYRVFPGGKACRDVVLTTHPLLAPRSRMSRAILYSPSRTLVACYRVNFPLPYNEIRSVTERRGAT
jgi:hypothetical protein